jgi:[ribosomal protein S5]-alanine N-acetyltransferase
LKIKNVHLSGLRIYLTPFERQHAEDHNYFQWLTDFKVYRYLGREEYFKAIKKEDLISYAEEMWANPFVYFYAVHSTATGDFIGTAKINFINQKFFQNSIADIGIMIGNTDYWGKRLSIDIIHTLSSHALFSMGIRKLTAGVNSLNEPMIKAFLRVGFKVDGSLRNQLIVCGEYCDHVLMSCFSDELIAPKVG